MGTTEKFAAGFLDRLGAVGEAEHQREGARMNSDYYWKNVSALAENPQALDETERQRFDRFCRDVGKLPDAARSDIAAVRRARESEPIISRAADIRRELSQASHALLHPPTLSAEMTRLCLPGYLRARRQELSEAQEQAWQLDDAEGAVADLAARKAGLGHQRVFL